MLVESRGLADYTPLIDDFGTMHGPTSQFEFVPRIMNREERPTLIVSVSALYDSSTRTLPCRLPGTQHPTVLWQPDGKHERACALQIILVLLTALVANEV